MFISTTSLFYDIITIDFVIQLSIQFHDFDVMMSVTDKCTKKNILISKKSTYTTKKWADLLFDGLSRSDWGIFNQIIFDRDRKVIFDLWKAIFNRLRTKLLMATAYHAQTDDQSEKTNQTVEIALRFLSVPLPASSFISLERSDHTALPAPLPTSSSTTGGEEGGRGERGVGGMWVVWHLARTPSRESKFNLLRQQGFHMFSSALLDLQIPIPTNAAGEASRNLWPCFKAWWRLVRMRTLTTSLDAFYHRLCTMSTEILPRLFLSDSWSALSYELYSKQKWRNQTSISAYMPQLLEESK